MPICDAICTPFGRYGGALASVRTDDLAAILLKALMARNPGVRWEELDDTIFGCANQAGEDNRNVAHMATLLAGLPLEIPGSTLNRLCGSGLDAFGTAARAIRSGETSLMLAGGVESMSRAPFVMGKADSAFSRNAAIYDTAIGWRFVNKLVKAQYGVDSMPETAENVADDFKISLEDQDKFALAEDGLCPESRCVRCRDYAGIDSSAQRRRHRREQGRASTRNYLGVIGQAQRRGA
jgi:acetyl-CoA acyltransferase